MSAHQQLHTALLELEATLKAANLWRMPTPEASAFTSQQPFCIDTMTLLQWLRFVFIARLYALADAGGALPPKCDVAPAIAEHLKQENVRASDHLLVVRAVERIDQLVTNH